MFTIIYLYFTFILLPHLDASSRRSDNESDPYLNYNARRIYYGQPAKLGDVPYQVIFCPSLWKILSRYSVQKPA